MKGINDFDFFAEVTKNTRREHVPFSVVFELTPQCTLDCNMCYVHLTKQQMDGNQELSAAQWNAIIDDAVGIGTTFVLLTGGECLLHPEFKDIFLHLKQKPVFISINSNATLLNDDYIDFFVHNPPSRINISLYGMSEDTYEKLTGRRLFTRVRNNILKLKTAGINVKLHVTVSKLLYDDVTEIVYFAIRNNIPYSVDTALFQANDNTERDVNAYGLLPEECAIILREIRKIEGKTIYKNPQISELPVRENDLQMAKSLRCGAGSAFAFISWKGFVNPCIWTNGDVLNAAECGFKKAWERAIEIARDYIIPVECIRCKYSKVCHPCAIFRTNPDDPGHCNPAVCKTTIAKINAGVVPWSE